MDHLAVCGNEKLKRYDRGAKSASKTMRCEGWRGVKQQFIFLIGLGPKGASKTMSCKEGEASAMGAYCSYVTERESEV